MIQHFSCLVTTQYALTKITLIIGPYILIQYQLPGKTIKI
jgi:hypothetical protein